VVGTPAATGDKRADAVPTGTPPDAGPASPDGGSRTPDAGPELRDHKRRATGQVSIDASPFAVLWIDGKEVGTTPLLRYPLPDGTHRVMARTEDGRTRRIRIRVRAGKLTVERITFE
jgi:serine/threonine-protein kinase